VEDLLEQQDVQVIFFWDEMPLMLDNIKQDNGEKTAMEVLDTLRSLRQMYPGLRMVYTGSIGLHHVVSSLKKAGYANAPTNNMDIVDVPPLSTEDAQELARRLLEGERIAVADSQTLSISIAQAVDGVPFYIHHVVDGLKWWNGEINVAAVAAVVNTCLSDPNSRWNMDHYRKRLDTYYAPGECALALNLMDVLAISEQALTFDALFRQPLSRIKIKERDTAREILTLLQRDHYIIQQPDGAYRFRFPLIRRWWRLHRGLP
jgi:hypothetical protein